ncbi:outer membrane beta-barrel protein [Dysgonomonas sp. 511]|uniref:outer membrane beta-barrel protein n=1 Tax=Dysgonomonas sp. 511 TaxID=2302930 RepID=UPI0013D19C77|nr:outer membrane beta-barrel protein [Dysgonomonas sp. 511]NDV77952.1 hypothetical protein [Dysgonomonas sp. 511]
MKKILLVAALAMTCLFANAQDDLQGKWFVGGAVGYTSKSSSFADKKDNSFVIKPTVGTFISSDLAVGASLGYSNSKRYTGRSEDANGNVTYTESKENQFIIEPFVRKYWTIAGGLKFFGEASLPVAFGDVKDSYSTTSVGLAIAPGFEYFINSWISVDTKFHLFGVAYENTSYDAEGVDSKNGFAVGGNTHYNNIGDLTIGVKFLF